MAKYVELRREEEYYRHGVWKIFYRVEGTDYMCRGERKGFTDGSNGPYEFDGGADEIKFSGKDAKERSLAIFNQMLEENKGL